ENESVIATESRNHNCYSHDRRTSAGKNYVRRFRRHSIARRILNRSKRQRGEISNICEQIQADHEKRAKRERERHVAARIDHLASRERDVVPSVCREKRISLRHANSHEEAKSSSGCQTYAYLLQVTPYCPEVAKVFCACTGSQADDDAEHDQCDQRTSFCRGENVLHQFSDFQTACVRECKKCDQRKTDQL